MQPAKGHEWITPEVVSQPDQRPETFRPARTYPIGAIMAADGNPAGLKNNQPEIKLAPPRRPSGRGGRREGAGRKPGSQSKATIDGRLLAQEYGPAAIRKAAEMAGLIFEVVPNAEGDGEMETPIGQAASESVRVSALNIIIERAYGKAAQPLNHGDNEGGKLSPTLNIFGSGDS